MRSFILTLTCVAFILLLGVSLYLPEDKKVDTEIVTLVNNETVISKSVKHIQCEDGSNSCDEYYANFSNHSELINKVTYNKIKEGEKVTLTVVEKNLNWLSFLLIFNFIILSVIIFAFVMAKSNSSSIGGEYYG